MLKHFLPCKSIFFMKFKHLKYQIFHKISHFNILRKLNQFIQTLILHIFNKTIHSLSSKRGLPINHLIKYDPHRKYIAFRTILLMFQQLRCSIQRRTPNTHFYRVIHIPIHNPREPKISNLYCPLM